MYPKNTTSPRRIRAKVVSATDGSAITSGVTAFHIQGTTRSAVGGTAAAHLNNGMWGYTPTTAETDFDEFSIEFYHSGAVGSGPVVQVFTSTVYDEFAAFDETGFDSDDFKAAIATAVRIELGMAASDMDTQLDAIVSAIGSIVVDSGLTTDQWTALKRILGIPSSGSTPTNPAVGALADILSGYEDAGFDSEQFTTDVAAAVLAEIGTGWTEVLTESYPAFGAAPTAAQMMWMIYAGMLQRELDGTSLKILKSDGSTAAATFTITLNTQGYPIKVVRTS